MNKNKTGGNRLIGQGAYGCAFKPNIPCRGEKLPKHGIISKLVHDSEAINEVNELKIINKIDPDNLYHLQPLNVCKYQTKYDDTIKDLKDCNITKKYTSDKLSIIQYKDGGLSLQVFLSKYHEHITNKNEVLLMIKTLHNMFIGLNDMSKINYGHFDIKTPNIVIDPNGFKMFFIDFGLARKFTQIYKNNINPDISKTQNLFLRNYYVYPLESVLLHKETFEYAKHNTEQFILDLSVQYKSNSFLQEMDNFYFYIAGYYPYKSILNNKSSSYKNIINLINNFSYEDVFTLLIEKIDIFSFGLVMFHIIFFIKKCVNLNKITFKNPLEFEGILETILFLAKSMSNPNNIKRLNTVESLNFFEKQILPKISKLEKNEQFVISTQIRQPERTTNTNTNIFGYISNIFRGNAAAGAGNSV